MGDKSDPQVAAATQGIQLEEAHYPGRAPIDAYGNGGFRFAGMSHRGSLMCLPSGIYGWNIETSEELQVKNFQKLIEETDEIEILLIGSGVDLVPINPKLRKILREGNVSADAMSTGAAVRTFNILLGEGRAVAAALLAVE